MVLTTSAATTTAPEDRAALIPPPGHDLDRSVWASLAGHHARFAERHGLAVRYDPEVAPFVALADPADPRAWADAAALLGPDAAFSVTGAVSLPEGWEVQAQGESVQLVDTGLEARPYAEAVRLGAEDVPEILELVARAKPGPFRPRTVELGTYLGIRRDGVLVAMAGERQHPPGWTEISAVCTDEAYRGQGLATALVRAVAAGIRERGETPFLHARGDNTNAIRLYESLGFTLRRRSLHTMVRLTVR
ncbi:GNAT family N-acetyltransferase [Actinospica durhamensis]|uniref:GNAT family N-acetyltransferase n=1 Tax=Actinospica durhamensis TaxID=1508375 RepID=UPI003F68782D